MTILVIAEHDNSELKAATLNAVAAAKAIGGDIDLLVAGKSVASVIEAATAIAGVGRVLVADADMYEHHLAEVMGDLVTSQAAGYSHVLAASTSTSKDYMPRAAALLGVNMLSDVTEVVSEDTFSRPIYAGGAIATYQTADPIKLLTVRATGFDAVEATGGSAEQVAIDFTSEFTKTEFVSEELAKSDRPELTSANVVVAGGRGLQNSENFQMLFSLADKIGAAVGASRAAVDAGFVPNDLQVGQTGKIVAPSLYIAVGISGAIQHLAGMKDSKVIVAVNKDEEAPIFQVSDYGLVADLFDVVPELQEKL